MDVFSTLLSLLSRYSWGNSLLVGTVWLSLGTVIKRVLSMLSLSLSFSLFFSLSLIFITNFPNTNAMNTIDNQTTYLLIQ